MVPVVSYCFAFNITCHGWLWSKSWEHNHNRHKILCSCGCKRSVHNVAIRSRPYVNAATVIKWRLRTMSERRQERLFKPIVKHMLNSYVINKYEFQNFKYENFDWSFSVVQLQENLSRHPKDVIVIINFQMILGGPFGSCHQGLLCWVGLYSLHCYVSLVLLQVCKFLLSFIKMYF